MLIRGDSLDASMPRYLVDRIKQNPRIIVSPRTQVTALTGTGQLEGVRIRRAAQPAEPELPIRGLFVFIGAKPRTGWLAGQLAEDSHGFLLTGTDIPVVRLDDESMNPLFLETSRPRDLRRRRRPQRVSQARRGRHRRRLDGGTAGLRPPPVRRDHRRDIELGTGSPRA